MLSSYNFYDTLLKTKKIVVNSDINISTDGNAVGLSSVDEEIKLNAVIHSPVESINANNACPTCGKIFLNKRALAKHCWHHRSPEHLNCEYCNKVFDHNFNLARHKLLHKSNICYYCNHGFRDNDEMLKHLNKLHSDFKFICHQCPKKFKMGRDLRTHNKIQHKNASIYFYCGICEVTGNEKTNYESHEDILQHLKDNHECKSSTNSDTDEVTVALESVYEFLDESFMPNANELCDFIPPDIENKTPTKPKKIKQNCSTVQPENMQSYNCPRCPDITCTEISELKLHLAHDHDIKILVCNECGSIFNRFDEYKDHCNRHIEVNTSEDAYSRAKSYLHCIMCDKDFKTLSGFKYHIKTHTGTKLIDCPYCDSMKFLTSINLNAHLKAKHSNTIYGCKHCDKKFKTLDGYRKHQHNREKNHACEFCDKVFYQKCHLYEHMWTHTEFRPYTCEKCNKSFLSKSYLNKHSEFKKCHRNVIVSPPQKDSG